MTDFHGQEAQHWWAGFWSTGVQKHPWWAVLSTQMELETGFQFESPSGSQSTA